MKVQLGNMTSCSVQWNKLLRLHVGHVEGDPENVLAHVEAPGSLMLLL